MTKDFFLKWVLNQGAGENIYDPWLTVKEAAALYRVSTSTIQRRVKAGKILKSKLARGDRQGMRVAPPNWIKPLLVLTNDGIKMIRAAPSSIEWANGDKPRQP